MKKLIQLCLSKLFPYQPYNPKYVNYAGEASLRNYSMSFGEILRSYRVK